MIVACMRIMRYFGNVTFPVAFVYRYKNERKFNYCYYRKADNTVPKFMTKQKTCSSSKFLAVSFVAPFRQIQ